jgi:hypothetical protein
MEVGKLGKGKKKEVSISKEDKEKLRMIVYSIKLLINQMIYSYLRTSRDIAVPMSTTKNILIALMKVLIIQIATMKASPITSSCPIIYASFGVNLKKWIIWEAYMCIDWETKNESESKGKKQEEELLESIVKWSNK